MRLIMLNTGDGGWITLTEKFSLSELSVIEIPSYEELKKGEDSG